MRRALQLGACCAFLVFMLAAAEASESGTACEQSGYCSIGKLRPFFGDIYPGSGLREALEARSYKKEIILMAITSSQVGGRWSVALWSVVGGRPVSSGRCLVSRWPPPGSVACGLPG
eukprot:gene13143-3465_t